MSWLIDRSREQTDEENHPRKEELVTSLLRPGVCSVTSSSSHGLQANTKSLEMLYKPGSGYRERGRAANTAQPRPQHRVHCSAESSPATRISSFLCHETGGWEGPRDWKVPLRWLKAPETLCSWSRERCFAPPQLCRGSGSPTEPTPDGICGLGPAKPWASRATPAPPLPWASPRDQNP